MLLHACVHTTCVQCSSPCVQGQGPLHKADSYSRSPNISQHDLYVAYGKAFSLIPSCMLAVLRVLLLHWDNPVWSNMVGLEDALMGASEWSVSFRSGLLCRSRHWLAPVWKGLRRRLHLTPHLHGCHSVLQSPRGILSCQPRQIL